MYHFRICYPLRIHLHLGSGYWEGPISQTKHNMKLKHTILTLVGSLSLSTFAFVANAGESCDGAKTVEAWSSGSCVCKAGSCTYGSWDISAYTSCGGTGSESCTTTQAKVGTYTPCTSIVDEALLTALTDLHEQCYQAWLARHDGSSCTCPPVDNCAATTCIAGTASDVLGAVYSTSSGTCN